MLLTEYNGLGQREEIEGRVEYVSPEKRVSLGDSVKKADVFALGAVLFHMARLWLPVDFDTTNLTLLADIIRRNMRHLPYSFGFKELLGSMLDCNPTTRPSMKEVLRRLRHPLPCASEVPRLLPHYPLPNIPVTEKEVTESPEIGVLLESLHNLGSRACLNDIHSVYLPLFELYSEQGLKLKAEEIANQAILHFSWGCTPHNFDIFMVYQSFINAAIRHWLNHLSETLLSAFLSRLKPYPDRIYERAYCYRKLFIVYSRLGRLRESCKYVQKWLKIRKSSTDSIEILVNAASVLCQEGMIKQGIALAAEALDLKAKELGHTHIGLLPILSLLVDQTQSKRDFASFRVYYKHYSEVKIPTLPAVQLREFIVSSLKVWFRWKEYGEIGQLVDYLAKEKLESDPNLEDSEYLEAFATSYKKRKQFLSAHYFYELSLNVKEKQNQPLQDLLRSLKGLLICKKALGILHDFQPLCRRFLRIVEETTGTHSPKTLKAVIFTLALVKDTHLTLFAEELSIRKEVCEGKSVSELAKARNYYAQGQFPKALSCSYEALSSTNRSYEDVIEATFLIAKCSPQDLNLLQRIVNKFKMKAYGAISHSFSEEQHLSLAQWRRHQSVHLSQETWDLLLVEEAFICSNLSVRQSKFFHIYSGSFQEFISQIKAAITSIRQEEGQLDLRKISIAGPMQGTEVWIHLRNRHRVKRMLCCLAEALLLQQQAFSSLGDVEGAQSADRSLSLVVETLEQDRFPVFDKLEPSTNLSGIWNSQWLKLQNLLLSSSSS